MNSSNLESERDGDILDVRLVGRGENAIRMDKRLKCAGRALGVQVRVDWQAENYGEPLVTVGGKVLMTTLLKRRS